MFLTPCTGHNLLAPIGARDKNLNGQPNHVGTQKARLELFEAGDAALFRRGQRYSPTRVQERVVACSSMIDGNCVVFS